MATGQSDDELMRILKFDADDLKQNQSGQASLQQRVNLLLKANHFLLIMLVLTPVGVVWWIGDHQPVLQIVGLVALTAVVAAFNRPSLKILRDALEGQVVEASGTITVRLYTYDRRTVLGMLGDKYGNGVIDGAVFHVPVEMADVFQGRPLRIFYTAHYRQALSGELLLVK